MITDVQRDQMREYYYDMRDEGNTAELVAVENCLEILGILDEMQAEYEDYRRSKC